MQNLVLHPDAARELEAAAEWLGSERPRASAMFLRAIDEALDRLIDFPHLGGRLRGGLRRVVLPDWRHSIIYAVEPWGIYVIAIAHHSRKPNYWRHRLR